MPPDTCSLTHVGLWAVLPFVVANLSNLASSTALFATTGNGTLRLGGGPSGDFGLFRPPATFGGIRAGSATGVWGGCVPPIGKALLSRHSEAACRPPQTLADLRTTAHLWRAPHWSSSFAHLPIWNAPHKAWPFLRNADNTLSPKVAGMALASIALAPLAFRVAALINIALESLNFDIASPGVKGCVQTFWTSLLSCLSKSCRPLAQASRNVDGGITSHASYSHTAGPQRRTRCFIFIDSEYRAEEKCKGITASLGDSPLDCQSPNALSSIGLRPRSWPKVGAHLRKLYVVNWLTSSIVGLKVSWATVTTSPMVQGSPALLKQSPAPCC